MESAYISYTEPDFKLAKEVAAEVSRCGLRAFVSLDDFVEGEKLALARARKLKDSDDVVFIASEQSLNSQWCRRELDFARKLGRRIISVGASQGIFATEAFRSSIVASFPALAWDGEGKAKLRALLRSGVADAAPAPMLPLPSPAVGAAAGAPGSTVLSAMAAFLHLAKRKVRIKLVANKDCTVLADNKPIAQLRAKEVAYIKLAKGQYYLLFKPLDAKIKEKSMALRVEKNDELICINFPEPAIDVRKTIKCFIAGSTKLEAERDALRAGIARTHNAWRSKNCEILSYTYEDFVRTVVDGGHQSKYDEFIENEATIAVFIISGEIGEFTLVEFDKAMAAFTGAKHPQILVFNDLNAPVHEQSEKLKAKVTAQQQYWADYDSLSALKLQFMHTLDWLLIDMYFK
ncbi:MAG: toll/interleukin-1 receptor domain-containing protein [Muribaculaceae bacterium]|nr:toll/interleukin-1 receptor domain-containing protein [Muribaculaceae bacterium]